MRAGIAAALVFIATVQSAQALTIRDVIELTRAGLTDDVLVALIEVDGGVYATDTATLKSLKESGVSERVMIALIRSGRERRLEEPLPPPPPIMDDTQLQTPPAPAPQVVVIEHHEPQVQQVAVPVYIPVYTTRRPHRRDDSSGVQESTFVPFQAGSVNVRPRQEPAAAAAPAYWGFGGKLRPDAWGQPQEHDRKAADVGPRGSTGDKGDKGDKPSPTKK